MDHIKLQTDDLRKSMKQTISLIKTLGDLTVNPQGNKSTRKKKMKVYIEDLTINLILPYVVFNDMATHNSKIYRLSYFDLLHKNSQFLTLRSILKDLSSNSCQLVISTKLDH